MDRYAKEVSGGCQCGAVRYHATEMLDNAHVCHCRMCQKAMGNIFAALVAAPREAIIWTRGQPSRFRSSEHVDRGFCNQCGTPLFYEDVTGNRVNFTIGSLDHPEDFPPGGNTGTEGMVPWFPTLPSLHDGGPTGGGKTDNQQWADAIAASSHQHPDHDTAIWPPK